MTPSTPQQSAASDSEKDAAAKPDDGAAALRSVHTTTLPEMLAQLAGSLMVSTYQAGKLVLLRPEPHAGGNVLNTHFRTFNKPMGLAWEPGRMALGTATEIVEFHDMPAVARKLPATSATRPHDAAFLPRTSHVTGDVQIHEMAWGTADDGIAGSTQPGREGLSELYFINTRFSCLAVRSNLYSFIPLWRPPFITALAPQDRCHLNGLGLRDGKPKYVTALGASDTPGGWRDHKRAGGMVMDVTNDQIIARGLSMPHSPRWHDGRLWVLQSGNGGVGTIDLGTGRYEEICRLPGFTRGLDFAGPYAFVGLSQVRESAIFSGIAIAEMPAEERCCGVWAIDTRTGRIAGFVKFMDAVQEVFAVQFLPGLLWPEVLSEDRQRIAESYELPDEALRQVPTTLRQPPVSPTNPTV